MRSVDEHGSPGLPLSLSRRPWSGGSSIDSVEKKLKAWLAAIVESSSDAILSKMLDGTITSWNASAERIFGFSAAEAIGQSILILIPEDRIGEEDAILKRIRRGERIEDFETVRKRKDGSLVEVSVTISPVRGKRGKIIGASKIARDISERRRLEHRQKLLLREMNHRIKNLFSVASALISQTKRSAQSVDELADRLQERLAALTRAHDLILPDLISGEANGNRKTTLFALLEAILAPFRDASQTRLKVEGTDVAVGGTAVTSLALIFHEFATNSAKYGCLSVEGELSIQCLTEGQNLHLTWTETGCPTIDAAPRAEGFGGQLERAIVTAALRGRISREWSSSGLIISMRVPISQLDT
ncbi:PAS domain S-box protein [Rhizobium sp. IMFF44]|uniref:PAS domain S-box protein n=1 Tax=Rhizobium sp. IMFF44 TaxID=3342350 RepID=UPI0035BA4F1E